jgi:L-fuculose-phosphate aldolase
MNDKVLKQQLADITTELYRAGVVTASGGNISVRSMESERALWITPTAICKASLSADDMTLIGLDGTIRAGNHPPSIEFAFHTGLMNARPEINAVVHSHAPYAIVWGLGDLPVPPVSYDTLLVGKLPFIPWHMVGSMELARAVIDAVGKEGMDGAFLRNHGLVTIGKDLRHAADITLMVEHTLKVLHLARQINLSPVELDERSIEQLQRLAESRDR